LVTIRKRPTDTGSNLRTTRKKEKKRKKLFPADKQTRSSVHTLAFLVFTARRRQFLFYARRELRHFGQREMVVEHVVQLDRVTGNAQHDRDVVVPLGVVERAAGFSQPAGRVHAETRPLQGLRLQRQQIFGHFRAAARRLPQTRPTITLVTLTLTRVENY